MTDLLQAAKEVIRQISVEHLSENAVESLRQAINEAENAMQEPVAWLYDWEHEGEIVTGWVTQDFETTKFNNGHNVRPLYAAHIRTKDLTDDEIYDVCKDVPFVVIGPDYDLAIARAVIAADRELNK